MNTRTLRRIMALGITLTLFGVHLAAQSADPIIGTSVLNVAKVDVQPRPCAEERIAHIRHGRPGNQGDFQRGERTAHVQKGAP